MYSVGFVSLINLQNNLSLKTGFRHHFPKTLVHKPADPRYRLLACTEMHVPASLLFDEQYFFNLSPAVQAYLSMLSFACIAAVMRHSAVKADLVLRLWEEVG